VMVRLDLAKIVMVIAPLTATLVWVIYLCGATLNLDEVVPWKLLMIIKVACQYGCKVAHIMEYDFLWWGGWNNHRIWHGPHKSSCHPYPCLSVW
jgi:hypothetical protein